MPLDNSIRRDIIYAHHDTPPAGHPGQGKTIENVSRNYWWPGMTKFINEYVSTGNTCNQNKLNRDKPHGFLKPIDVSTIPWKKVATDFIVKLPLSNRYNSILTIGDMGTKQIHFIPCNETIHAAGTATLFINNVFKLHGVPESITSDCGPQFTANYIKEIYKGTVNLVGLVKYWPAGPAKAKWISSQQCWD